MFITKDSSLGGYQSIVSKHLNGFAVEGCKKLDLDFDSGYGCPFHVRRLNIWSKKSLGPLQLSGPGYDTPATFAKPVEGQNAGHLVYADGYNGYGALAIVGRNYTMTANLSSDVYVDFSESYIPAYFNESDEEVHLTTEKGECDVRASEAHGLFYTRFGPKRGASLGACKKALGLPCHTTVKDDVACFPHVNWAYTWGLKAYPKQFKTLTVGASWEEIQMYYYLTDQGDCPEPCPPNASSASTQTPAPNRLLRR